MLRYYSYYSVGGYKNFILGDSESKAESTFYLPLLPVLEERAESDKEAARQVAELKKLPAIKQLSADNTYDLPSSANTLFSHAGYKLLYKHLEGDKYAIALRDITPDTKDEVGRAIPFLIVIVGDTDDLPKMDILATYIAGNIKKVEQFIIQSLYMDIDKNGLRFDLKKFNTWIENILKSNSSSKLLCVSGGKRIVAYRNKVALMLLPDGMSKETALNEQKIIEKDVVIVPISDVIPKDNPEKLAVMLASVSEQLQDERQRNALLRKGLIISGLIGLAIGLIAGCSHK